MMGNASVWSVNQSLNVSSIGLVYFEMRSLGTRFGKGVDEIKFVQAPSGHEAGISPFLTLPACLVQRVRPWELEESLNLLHLQGVL